MSQVKGQNTKPELAVRRLIFGMGYRYRLHDKRLPGKPDLVFPGRRKVIFVHGCFWHGHVDCRYGRLPKSRTDFWRKKIVTNQKRDRKNVDDLLAANWCVLIVWQCELKEPKSLIQKIDDFLKAD